MKYYVSILLLNILCITIHSQSPQLISEISGSVLEGSNHELNTDRIDTYIDCDDCDFSFIKEKITYINYVRDVHLAQIYVLITDNGTGGGGELYTLDFIGKKEFTGINFTFHYTELPTDTHDETRTGLTNKLSMGLLFFMAHTQNAQNLDLAVTKNGHTVRDTAPDKWNYWIFDIYAGGEIKKETSEENIEGDISIEARKITEEWKYEFDVDIEYRERDINDGDNSFQIISRNNNLDIEIVKSINDHWSVGLKGDFYSSTYVNIERRYSLSPAVEYSVFPYREVNRREFTFAYYLDYDFVDYYEETIYFKKKEHLPNQEFALEIEYTQPWGYARFNLRGQQYLHDLSKYNVGIEGRLSWRILKGLSIRLSGNFRMIHDQLYIPREEATLEEILVRQRKIKTDYEFELDVGLSYTFGSVYNNVVNTRL